MGRPLALTPGEPAGIGPDIVIAWAQAERHHDVVVIADPDLLARRAQRLDLPLSISTDLDNVTRAAGALSVLPISLRARETAGALNAANADYVLETLNTAVDGCLAQDFSGLVTGPVQKSVINDAGIDFSGHTEFLASRCGVDRVVMLLVAGALRVALATTHVPLRAVADAITRERLEDVLEVLIEGLESRFRIGRPRVLVAGLNPHAGEGGYLGREDIDIIAPVCRSFAGRGVVGPIPADTLFTPKVLAGADAVLAMYHDQGLPVLKHVGFGHAVNVTLGLPIVRTSVDHGTALDIAGTGNADAGSLVAAVALAIDLSA